MDATNPPQRVICYVDGFNLYFGLIESDFRKYLWLDLHALASRLLLPTQALVETKYFTARISGARPSDNPGVSRARNEKRKRQTNYLDALATIDGLRMFEGKYREEPVTCHNCNSVWSRPEEKMTDVNIATEMLVDAFTDQFDTAILISGDSDLVPPVRMIIDRFADKRIIVAFPPGRHSHDLETSASGQFIIGKSMLKKSQLPDVVKSRSGYHLKRPGTWI